MQNRKTSALALLIALFLSLSLFAACGGDTVIASFKGNKIYLGEYADFIEFGRRLDLYEKRAAVENGLRCAAYLEKQGAEISDGDVATALRSLENVYFEGDAFAPYYKEVADAFGADRAAFRKSLKSYAAAVAAADKFASLYGENAAAVKEVADIKATVVVSEKNASTINGVSNFEADYNAFFGFSAACRKYETVKAIALYFGVDREYGKNADLTELESYYNTVYASLSKTVGYAAVLHDMDISENALRASSKGYYKNVFVYEKLASDYFADQYQLKKSAGTLPAGVTTPEEYAAYVLLETAADCKVENVSFKWQKSNLI